MTTLIIGGTGFIGRRLIPLLAKQGEDSVVMDINPQTANFSELAKVRVLRGDVGQFDDVMAAMTAVKPDRVINLAYYISSDLPPRVAFKLNVIGMDNCFEAARLAGCNRVVYASSVAVSGEQKFYGERIVNEDDFKHGHVQYAMHKIFNECRLRPASTLPAWRRCTACGRMRDWRGSRPARSRCDAASTVSTISGR